MYIKQISVFLQNIRGTLYTLTEFLGNNGIDLKAISVADTANFGIVRFIIDQDKIEDAAKLLRDGGYSVHVNHVICVSIPDKPSGLAQILGVLERENIAVEYLYSFFRNTGDNAVLILRLSDREAGAKLFEKEGVHMFTPAELA
ncbi:MAG: acetolactate synthase [Clostridia bacterium]|nr:acetolactate synthase [Clostridia bacterium]